MKNLNYKLQDFLTEQGIGNYSLSIIENAIDEKNDKIKEIFGNTAIKIFDIDCNNDTSTPLIKTDMTSVVRNHLVNVIKIMKDSGVSYDSWFVEELTSSPLILENRFSRDHEILAGDTTIKVSPGDKVIKVLMKISKAIGSIDIEDQVSAIDKLMAAANSFKKVRGKIVLSILPYDFFTLSHDSYGWTSCVAAGGDYFIGTTALLQSRNSFVAYFVRESDWKAGNINKKTWRRIITIEDDGACLLGVEYPRKIETLTNELKKILKLEDEHKMDKSSFSASYGLYYNEFKKVNSLEAFNMNKNANTIFEVAKPPSENKCIVCGATMTNSNMNSILCRCCNLDK